MAAVGDEGIAALLGSCHKLWELWLLECTGPFTPAMLASASTPQSAPGTASASASTSHSSTGAAGGGHSTPDSVDAGTSAAAQSSPYRWSLSSLQLCGAPVLLRDADLKALISGSSRDRTASTTTASCSSSSSAPDVRPAPRSGGGLHTLGLTNAPCITPGLLSWLAAAHSATLTHLRLEQVGAYGASHVKGSGESTWTLLHLVVRTWYPYSLGMRMGCEPCMAQAASSRERGQLITP
jgi:hypothetical protein